MSVWTIRAPSYSGEGPTLVAGQRRLLLLLWPAEDITVIRILCYEEDEEAGEDEGETAGAEEGYEVPKVAGNVGGGEWSGEWRMASPWVISMRFGSLTWWE